LTDKDSEFNPSDPASLERSVSLLFTFSLIWSVGATLDEVSRKQWDEFVHTMDPSIPPQDTVYEYCVDLNKLLWTKWEDKYPIALWKPPADMPYHRILVPTVDTLRHEFILKSLIKNQKNVLLVGVTGTGKTALANSISSQLPEKQWIVLNINFSAKTLSSQVQETIESRTDKRGKKYSAIGGKRLLTFIDDLNMPQHDEYHSQPPLELLRQWINYSGWYNRKDKETAFTQINGMQLMCSMGPPGGGRNPISNRTLNLFSMFNFLFPSDNQVKRIFSVLLEAKLESMEDEIKNLVEPITQATLNVYKRVIADLRPLPSKSHYIFNLRDLSHVFEGVRRAPKSLIDKDGVLRLWIHECYRVFHDRLIDDNDRNYFTQLMKDELAHSFKTAWTKVVPKDTPLIFCDFLHEVCF
jgi:dynein heavy chain